MESEEKMNKEWDLKEQKRNPFDGLLPDIAQQYEDKVLCWSHGAMIRNTSISFSYDVDVTKRINEKETSCFLGVHPWNDHLSPGYNCLYELNTRKKSTYGKFCVPVTRMEAHHIEKVLDKRKEGEK